MKNTIEIGEKEYELFFSVKATKEISKYCGGLEKIGDLLKESDENKLLEKFQQIIFIVTVLVNCGIEKNNLINKENTPTFSAEEIEKSPKIVL
jgi:hypothetical protein